MTPEEVGIAIARIRKYADDYGRRIDDDHFGVLFNFCFAEDAPEAAALARPYALRNRHDVDFAETSALEQPRTSPPPSNASSTPAPPSSSPAPPARPRPSTTSSSASARRSFRVLRDPC